MPTFDIIVDKRLGFLKLDFLARSSLKWTPLDLRSRKRLNLSLAAGAGEPGGEGGRDVAGNVGCVRCRIASLPAMSARAIGDVRASAAAAPLGCSTGPSIGPMILS